MCIVEDCLNEGNVAKGLCWKHYRRQLRTGSLELIPRKRSYRPGIRIEDKAFIPLGPIENDYPRYGYAEISPEDLWVEKHLWTLNGGYAKSRIDGKSVYLHKLITHTGGETEIDHINRNRLDNRRENLRPCSRSLNLLNKNPPSSNTSGHAGVTYNKADKAWTARISYQRKKIHLGNHKTKEEAIATRQRAETLLLAAIADQSVANILDLKSWLLGKLKLCQ